MRNFSYLFLIVFSFWILNCSAADEQEKRHIQIRKTDDGITFGILMTELTDKDREKLKAQSGARVIDVIEGSAADKAGLKAKDVITYFNGEKIETAKQLDKIVEDMNEGQDVTFKALRDGMEMTFKAKLEEMENKGYSYNFSDDEDGDNFVWHFSDDEEGTVNWFSDDGIEKEIIVNNMHKGPMAFFENESNKGGYLGIEAKNISDQLRDYFDVKHGVLVEKVLPDTPAEKAGLKAGDVITFIEGRKIEDYNDLIRTLNYYNPNEKVEIEYVRKGSENNVDVTLAEKKKDKFFFRNDDGETIIRGDGLPQMRMKKMLKDLDEPDEIDVKRIFYII